MVHLPLNYGCHQYTSIKRKTKQRNIEGNKEIEIKCYIYDHSIKMPLYTYD